MSAKSPATLASLSEASTRPVRMGVGEIGGKARGLVAMSRLLSERFGSDAFGDFEVGIPEFSVIGTEMFDRFMDQNHLYDLARSEAAFNTFVLETDLCGNEQSRTILPIAQPIAQQHLANRPYALIAFSPIYVGRIEKRTARTGVDVKKPKGSFAIRVPAKTHRAQAQTAYLNPGVS